MSLTRKMLKAMSIEDEKIDQIIEAHTETVDALKEERNKFKEDAEKLPEIQQKLDEALVAAENSNDEGWKEKYEELSTKFDNYKKDVADKEVSAAKEKAYAALLKDVGVSEKRIQSILKLLDVDSIELDDEGKIKDVDALSENIKTEWSDFIVTNQEHGAEVGNPPTNTGGNTFDNMSLTDKMSYANAHPDAPEVTSWLNN